MPSQVYSSLSILILNSQCKEGARDGIDIWYMGIMTIGIHIPSYIFQIFKTPHDPKSKNLQKAWQNFPRNPPTPSDHSVFGKIFRELTLKAKIRLNMIPFHVRANINLLSQGIFSQIGCQWISVIQERALAREGRLTTGCPCIPDQDSSKSLHFRQYCFRFVDYIR